ncbi:protein adenylyltransferase SelO [Vibrio algarum]|uniref:Protein nucleotidyltransferase YdiU n=1 Tax=Vibrio algarum TaxID=3020714 RepID=A0ABT4YX05_9VIBR|nr:YdiU family protein [Vibrio sp. KJ40-1]MDB1126114.1 YdiU family protein [Vibrio sp. KJ40-1]
MKLENTYYQLGEAFLQEIEPTPVLQPELFLWNDSLARELTMGSEIESNAALFFSGNEKLNGSIPIALAYAGHQFGGFNPQLGDGRAHLLGEVQLQGGDWVDIQLKGSGQTKFSRRGDGRCAIKPAIREYIMSEAMFALGVPTTRTLAVVTTGEELYRGLSEPGAVVTRVAKSHIRVGTFQYFSAKGDIESLTKLLDYAIERHYPSIDLLNDDRAFTFLDAVIDSQIKTIVHWMRVGFIHGVMNTDNMTISGETIDYGPCAMLGNYHPETVFSSIDENGRYCFGNQPSIMQWNMARLAESLIPLIKGEKDGVIKSLEDRILGITEKYLAAFNQMMNDKLGLLDSKDNRLVDQFLTLLQKDKLDYTQSFIELSHVLSQSDVTVTSVNREWVSKWLSVIKEGDVQESLVLMQKNNPIVIPRNHHVESILEQCKESLLNTSALNYLKVLSSPYIEIEQTMEFQDLPKDNDISYQTFCGT